MPAIKKHLKKLLFLLPYLIVIWIIVIADEVVDGNGSDVTKEGDLRRFGIVVRTPLGMRGIPIFIFLHVNFWHVAINTLGVSALGVLLITRGLKYLVLVSLSIIVIAGFGIWTIGRTGVIHMGSNPLCFGWWGYLMVAGLLEKPRKKQTIIVTLVTGVIYGALVLGFIDNYVLWVKPEANMCGLVSGILIGIAYFIGYRKFYRKWKDKRELKKVKNTELKELMVTTQKENIELEEENRPNHKKKRRKRSNKKKNESKDANNEKEPSSPTEEHESETQKPHHHSDTEAVKQTHHHPVPHRKESEVFKHQHKASTTKTTKSTSSKSHSKRSSNSRSSSRQSLLAPEKKTKRGIKGLFGKFKSLKAKRPTMYSTI